MPEYYAAKGCTEKVLDETIEQSSTIPCGNASGEYFFVQAVIY